MITTPPSSMATDDSVGLLANVTSDEDDYAIYSNGVPDVTTKIRDECEMLISNYTPPTDGKQTEPFCVIEVLTIIVIKSDLIRHKNSIPYRFEI